MINILKIIVASFLLAIQITSFASSPIVQIYYQFGNQKFQTTSEYCSAVVSTDDQASKGVYDSGSNRCYLYKSNGVLNSVYPVQRVEISKCADGSDPNFGLPQNQQCTDPPPPDCPAVDVGDIKITTDWLTGAAPGSAVAKVVMTSAQYAAATFCSNRCQVKMDIAKGGSAIKSCQVEQTASANGYFRQSCNVSMVGVGGACGGNEPAPDGGASSAPSTANDAKNGECPSGSVPAGQSASGMTVCKGVKPPTNAPPVNTVTGPKTPDGNGGTNQTTVDTTTNADGSTTKKTTTTNVAADGSSTTSVNSVTSAAPGGAPGTPSTPADASDMCKQHPELTVCQNSQVQGSCEQISCTGDAIQCATLRAAATLQCRDQEDRDGLKSSSSASLGDAIANGNDPMSGQIAGMLKGTSVDMSSQSLDQGGFLGGGTCFPDRTMTVFGRTVRLSFSAVCNNIQPLRYAFLAIGFILAYLIVSKSILQS